MFGISESFDDRCSRFRSQRLGQRQIAQPKVLRHAEANMEAISSTTSSTTSSTSTMEIPISELLLTFDQNLGVMTASVTWQVQGSVQSESFDENGRSVRDVAG